MVFSSFQKSLMLFSSKCQQNSILLQKFIDIDLNFFGIIVDFLLMNTVLY